MTQRYVSKEIIHFVGGNKQKNEQYEIFKTILSERKLGTGEQGFYSTKMRGSEVLSSNEVYTSDMVCFCDIPISDLEIHIKKYSTFGISFLKEYLIRKGASPIWYISKHSTVHPNHSETNCVYHDEMYQEFRYFRDSLDWKDKGNKLPEEVKPLFDYLEDYIFPYIKFFDAEKYDSDIENYYMEREWRLYGVLCFENLNNINRIILPLSFAKTFRKDFPDYIGQITYVEENNHL